jgi:hypothetical protein
VFGWGWFGPRRWGGMPGPPPPPPPPPPLPSFRPRPPFRPRRASRARSTDPKPPRAHGARAQVQQPGAYSARIARAHTHTPPHTRMHTPDSPPTEARTHALTHARAGTRTGSASSTRRCTRGWWSGWTRRAQRSAATRRCAFACMPRFAAGCGWRCVSSGVVRSPCARRARVVCRWSALECARTAGTDRRDAAAARSARVGAHRTRVRFEAPPRVAAEEGRAHVVADAGMPTHALARSQNTPFSLRVPHRLARTPSDCSRKR